MLPKYLFLCLFSCFLLSNNHAQNYLRVADPDAWDGPISIEPDWHEYQAHAQLEEVSIVTEPKGIFTEIGFYATISQGPDAWSWGGEYEIVWQFELPSNTIVHDSWLWVEQDIIKADLIDFWTALETYEDIVERNQDPSFFYKLPDNRYEIRIYPLFEGDSRRIKMSFLVPTVWNMEEVKTELLQNLLQGTQYPPPSVNIGMIVDDAWGTPELHIDNDVFVMDDTVLANTGQLMHYHAVSGTAFTEAENVGLYLDAPYNADNAYVSTYEEGGEQYYQIAYAPNWESLIQNTEGERTLLLMDYNEDKTDLSLSQFAQYVNDYAADYFSTNDYLNIGVMSTQGIRMLSQDWWQVDADLLKSTDTILHLLQHQDTTNLAGLLQNGFDWVNTQVGADNIYLFASNDSYVYPPVADEVFETLTNFPVDADFTIIDYQVENVSVLYYGGTSYSGNEYFYQLVNNSFTESQIVTLLEDNLQLTNALGDLFPSPDFEQSLLDVNTSLENGICFQRYSLNGFQVDDPADAVILQTGKYLGDFPMEIEASLISSTGDFWSADISVPESAVVPGDTLMREMWYGPHLSVREAQVSSNEERMQIIEESMQERILTGLTAFLALEPSQGGEPCIECLLNSGDIVIIGTTGDELLEDVADVHITPNPAVDFAEIILLIDMAITPADWQVTIYDATGRRVAQLTEPSRRSDGLVWTWNLSEEVQAGMYFVQIQSEMGRLTSKLIVGGR